MGKLIRAQIRILVCAWLIIICILSSSAQQDIYWTNEAKAAYEMIVDLRIEESMNIIRLQAITHPENLIWPYLQDYAMFLRLFVHEDPKMISGYLEESSERLDRVSVVEEKNAMSLMCQAQIMLHQCALRLQQSQFVAAATDLNKAFKLLKKNQKLHPDDYGNLRLYAAIKIAFGAIPDQYRWLVSMVTSLSGTIDEGLAELHTILQNSDPVNNIFFQETVIVTALAEGRFNEDPEEGIALLNKYFPKGASHNLIKYALANLMIASGDNEGAIKVLIAEPGDASAERIPYLDFMLGNCKLHRGDEDADIYFKNFLLFQKGPYYVKEAYQKLAWHSLLKGDRNGYFDYMQILRQKGNEDRDGDQQAQEEAETKAVPHPELLRSRLYFDGGYYEKCAALLNENLYKALTHRAHRLEYLYRKGRLLHALKSHAEALHYYNLTIRTGEYEPYYFACSAALHAGLIHESLGSEGAAERYYLICLQTKPETYATSLHQKARMGLSRMGR